MTSYTWKPPLGQTFPPAAPATSSATRTKVRSFPLASVVVYGSAWCHTLMVGSSHVETMLGSAGFVVSMMTPCDRAAE